MMANAYSILPAKSEENKCLRSLGVDKRRGARYLGFSRLRVKMYIKEARLIVRTKIYLTVGRDQCRSDVNTVIKLCFP
jgi:predicted transcriptional regulator